MDLYIFRVALFQDPFEISSGWVLTFTAERFVTLFDIIKGIAMDSIKMLLEFF